MAAGAARGKNGQGRDEHGRDTVSHYFEYSRTETVTGVVVTVTETESVAPLAPLTTIVAVPGATGVTAKLPEVDVWATLTMLAFEDIALSPDVGSPACDAENVCALAVPTLSNESTVGVVTTAPAAAVGVLVGLGSEVGVGDAVGCGDAVGANVGVGSAVGDDEPTRNNEGSLFGPQLESMTMRTLESAQGKRVRDTTHQPVPAREIRPL